MSIFTLPEHVRSKLCINADSGCWEYIGNDPSSNGYGRLWYNGIRQSAHRLVYSLLVGGKIEGRTLDHECCNRACCNPEHLTPMSHKRNCQLRDKRIKQGV